MFGISHNFNRLNAGTTNIVYRPGSSFLIAPGKRGSVYWFHFEKLDKKYQVPNIPRYTAQDTIHYAEKQLDAQLTENVRIWRSVGRPQHRHQGRIGRRHFPPL